MIASLKLFPCLEALLNMFGTFYLYASLVLLLLPAIMLVMPETKVCTLVINP